MKDDTKGWDRHLISKGGIDIPVCRHAHVVGLGKSGLAAAKLLLRNGWLVIGSDLSDKDQLSGDISEITALGAVVFLGGHQSALETEVDLAVLSPSVPLDSNVVEVLKEKNVTIIGELELGWRHCRGQVAAITGSNGKTTTTALLGEIFSVSGRPSFTCGNIGLPLSEVAVQTTDDTLLSVEVSSFQLMTIDSFRPRVAVLLNLSPDHIDWHGGFENYIDAKSRIWSYQTEDDWVVYSADDPIVAELVEKAPSRKFPFSVEWHDLLASRVSKENVMKPGAYISGDDMVAYLPDGSEFRMARDDLRLLGRHNTANGLAALSAALLLGVDPEAVQRGLAGFSGYPHRLETIRELNGVRWINDSKATNVGAGFVALEAVEGSIILIAGGRPKGGGFRGLRGLSALNRVKKAVLIGEAASDIERDIGDLIDTVQADDMDDAVRKARDLSEAGDTVLLSPLCASFDMFRSYEERGDTFRKLVEGLEDSE